MSHSARVVLGGIWCEAGWLGDGVGLVGLVMVSVGGEWVGGWLIVQAEPKLRKPNTTELQPTPDRHIEP